MDEYKNECTILVPKSTKLLQQNGGNPHKSVTFSFDRCYDETATTSDLYNEIPYSLVQVSKKSVSHVGETFFQGPKKGGL